MKKLLFLAVLLIILPLLAKAETYSDIINEGGNWLAGEYVVKQRGNVRNYQTMNIITRKSDGHFVYCIEPDIFVSEIPITGYTNNYAGISGLTEKEWERVSLLAYYGYGYKDINHDHSDSKWYVVTQYMIWHSVPTNQDIFFTDTLNGNRITKYEVEMAEMEHLLLKHSWLPSFSGKTYKMNLGEELTLQDTKGVLKGFQVSTNNKISITKTNEALKIKANETGNVTINLTRNNNNYGIKPIVYVDPNTQNVMFRGDVSPNKTSFSLVITGGNISVHKTGEQVKYDNDSYSYEQIALSNVTFDIYAKEDIYSGNTVKYKKDSLIGNIKTDDDGNCVLSNLFIGKYYLKEKDNPTDNMIDENIYDFEITKDQLNAEINVNNYLPKGKLEFTKKDDNNMPLKDATIIITKDENTIYEGKTDKNGQIILEDLPLGNYIIKEIKAPDGYLLSKKPIKFSITENEQLVVKEMINQKPEIIYNIPDTKSNFSYYIYVVLALSNILMLSIKSKPLKGLLFTINIGLIAFLIAFPYYQEKKENITQINKYYNNSHNKVVIPKNDYLAILRVPKINLIRGITNSKDVDKNIVILEPSLMPDINKGNLILAGHSGTGHNAYFKDLHTLEINDDIYIDYQNQRYHYILDNIYEIEKNGTAHIYRDKEKTTLTLITCKDNSNKQLVFIAYLKN